MGDSENNGKQLQIDRLVADVAEIKVDLKSVGRDLQDMRVEMAAAASGRETTCPIRPSVETMNTQLKAALAERVTKEVIAKMCVDNDAKRAAVEVALDTKVDRRDIKLLWGAFVGLLGVVATFLVVISQAGALFGGH